MKILIFSDVHRDKQTLEGILAEHKDAEYAISLGDSELKTNYLAQKDIIAIKGNYPFDSGFTYEHEMTLNNRKILIVHGHKYGVKYGIEKLYARMLETNVDIALYGHTHVASFDQVEKRILANPGAVTSSKGETPESYMTLELLENQCIFKWFDAKQHTLITDKEVKNKII